MSRSIFVLKKERAGSPAVFFSETNIEFIHELVNEKSIRLDFAVLIGVVGWYNSLKF
jgi:hypothetical protein